MRLAIRDASAYRCSDARRLLRIHSVHIQREMKSGRPGRGYANCFIHYRAQSALVDVAHGKYVNTGVLDVTSLLLVHRAHSDQRHIRRVDFWGETQDAGQVLQSDPYAASERHAVNIAAR